MIASEPADLTWITETRNVFVLHWPAEASEAQRLERDGVPHLLLVEAGTAPPVTGSCFEDWLNLPATDLEIRTRMVGLARRAAHHSPLPSVDHLGQLSFRGQTTFLSPIDQRLAHALIEQFGAVVAEHELIDRVWSAGASNQTLRVHVSRLRQRVEPIGLTIRCVRSAGYVMTDREPESPDQH